MKRIFWVTTCALLLYVEGRTQGITRRVYYDSGQQRLKIRYEVKDTVNYIPHGRYISYFKNGQVRSQGVFRNAKPVGEWSFFHKTGEVKMTSAWLSNGAVKKVYYYKNGNKRIEGYLRNNDREGVWKTYFEEGPLKREIDYQGDTVRCKEYYPSGVVKAKGYYQDGQKDGYWRYFSETGKRISEGNYSQGQKEGIWKYYHPSGELAAQGAYQKGLYDQEWTYFYKNANISARGRYEEGKKTGPWNTFDDAGELLSTGVFNQGTGRVKEYYPTGEARAIGTIKDEKKEGHWTYFYKDGKKRGECDFSADYGLYKGYYPDGGISTQGYIEHNRRVGLWKIYDQNNKLTGYYKALYGEPPPTLLETDFYDQDAIPSEFPPMPPMPLAPPADAEPKDAPSLTKKGYLQPRFPEYRGIIVQTNPFFTFLGRLPISFEFYAQERIGYEFFFEIQRDPFFVADRKINKGEAFTRGYAIAIKQKFYNPINRWLMWYFGHEIVFTSVVHSVNIVSSIIGMDTRAQAEEFRIEYGPLVGARLMQHKAREGLTLDLYAGIVIGYRNFSVSMYEDTFSGFNQDPFSYTFQFGVNIGYSISVRD